jgi:hypothetical protein
MKLANTPRPTTWNRPLASFPPTVLIVVTSSSNSLPHLVAAVFWWMASVERLDRCGGRQRRRQFIEKHLGQRASRTGPETGQTGRPGPTGPGPFRPRFAPRCFSVNCWLAPFCMWALDVVFSTVYIELLVAQASASSVQVPGVLCLHVVVLG